MAEGSSSPVDALVVAAMEEELRPLRRRLSDRCGLRGRAKMVRGWLAGRRVLLAATGDGPRNALAGAGEALAAGPPRIVIAIGLAGGLSGDLRSGDLAALVRVVRERGGPERRGDATLLEAAGRFVRPAVAVSAERIADTVAAKRRLLALACPQPGLAAVVDLESAAFAEGAESAGVPWLILRAVSDTAAEELPPLLNRALDEGGAVGRGRVLAGLVGEPSALPSLLRLRRRLGACAEALAGAVERVLRSDRVV